MHLQWVLALDLLLQWEWICGLGGRDETQGTATIHRDTAILRRPDRVYHLHGIHDPPLLAGYHRGDYHRIGEEVMIDMRRPKADISNRALRIGGIVTGLLWIIVGAVILYFLTCPNSVRPEPEIAKEYKSFHVGSH